MNLEQAFSRVVELERQQIVEGLSWRSVDIWPLIRQCLWFELSQVERPAGPRPATVVPPLYRRVLNRVYAELRAFLIRPASVGDETIAFVSRPVYLQQLPDGTLFDRIVDPLVFCRPDNIRHAKYYVAPWSGRQALHFPAKLLNPTLTQAFTVPAEHRAGVLRVAEAAGIAPERLLEQYTKSLQAFDGWYEAGQRFFASRKNLKTVYLTSWYFPDMMGLIAAARERGIETVDVQHGKQGKLQAMYSGWRIPADGYQMMPNTFWCWGRPSANHILASSPDRKIHRPIVGGYPWLDYYRRQVSTAGGAVRDGTSKCVLVTTQSRHGANIEPIPDFLIEFLRDAPDGVRFVFRCHPNDRNGPEYCRHRLSGLPTDRYDIDDGRSNLYDQMIAATHHITAYSSCCYEAGAFGVPTLLFGADARTIYSTEIETSIFSWTPGSASDLVQWLSEPVSNTKGLGNEYIFSSLEHASTVLREGPQINEVKECLHA